MNFFKFAFILTLIIVITFVGLSLITSIGYSETSYEKCACDYWLETREQGYNDATNGLNYSNPYPENASTLREWDQWRGYKEGYEDYTIGDPREA